MTNQELGEYVEKFVLLERERCALICKAYRKTAVDYNKSLNIDSKDANFTAGRITGAAVCEYNIRIES